MGMGIFASFKVGYGMKRLGYFLKLFDIIKIKNLDYVRSRSNNVFRFISLGGEPTVKDVMDSSADFRTHMKSMPAIYLFTIIISKL